jgi:hypothetical protein
MPSIKKCRKLCAFGRIGWFADIMALLEFKGSATARSVEGRLKDHGRGARFDVFWDLFFRASSGARATDAAIQYRAELGPSAATNY